MLMLIENFGGLVILDEAYIDFSASGSLISELAVFPNLVILQTFSKAWGMAGIRLGMAFASQEIITILNHIKYPYNINVLTQRVALDNLVRTDGRDKWIGMILEQRGRLQDELIQFTSVRNILPSDANFLMVRFDHPQEVFYFLTGKKIIVRPFKGGPKRTCVLPLEVRQKTTC
jgi:histidinol-phosphate aminotransferase